MRVLCLTPSTSRLQSFSSTEFLVFSPCSNSACCNCVHLILFNSRIISVATVFMGDHGRRLFPMSSSAAKEKWHFWLLIHEGTHKKIHIQIIHIPFTSPCFLISRCLWRCRHTQQQTLSKSYWMKFRPSDSVRQQCKGWCTFGKVLLSSKVAMLPTHWRFLHWNLFNSHPFFMKTIF